MIEKLLCQGLLMLPNLKCHKKDKVFFYEEGVNVFISKNC